MKTLLVFFALWATGNQLLLSRTYDLPSLHVFASYDYLVRGQQNNLTCKVMEGWSYKKLADVVWFRDGQPLDANSEDYELGPDNTLQINNAKHFPEGEFQCQGWLIDIVLFNRERVDANLISPPLKLRKTRITKFEPQENNVTVYARPGSVARLPCPGIPDVIPGPPEVSFALEFVNETLGSSNGNSRFLSSNSGMQIAMVQPSDAGRYVCVVKNDYTKQERRSINVVELKVISNSDPESAQMPPEKLEVTWPVGPASTKERPIELEVVQANSILIECVIKNAKITWTKMNSTDKFEKRRVRQVFGNLHISNLQMSDAGIYVCKGQSHFDEKDEVLVYYNLIVHQPSDVQLYLTQSTHDRSWEISCYAQNLRYEIPMVFVNSTPLIDAVDRMGIPTKTNFYTNPINVTMMSRNNFSGSVQCISRPAMEEAEIYGVGLERGRSKNYYVLPDDERITSAIYRGPVNVTVVEGTNVELQCSVTRVSQRYWQKDGIAINLHTKSSQTRFHLLNSNSLKIDKVRPDDEGWYTCAVEDENREKYNATAYLSVIPMASAKPTFASFAPTDELKPKKKTPPVKILAVSGFVHGNDVRLNWVLEESEAVGRIATFIVQNRKDGETKWSEGTSSMGHTRSLYLVDLAPNTRFKFRVTAINEDKTASAGTESDWMETLSPMREYRPKAPKLLRADPHTSQSIRLVWEHEAVHNKSEAEHFVINYGKEEKVESSMLKIGGTLRSHILTGLGENTTYSFNIHAINRGGESDRSNIMTSRTLHPDEERRGLFSLLMRGITEMLPEDESTRTHVCLLLTIFPLFILAICCVGCCRYRSAKNDSRNRGANKFLDTSYNIYNQQKVHRNKLAEPYDPKEFFDNDNIDEHLPLRGNNNEDRVSLNSRSSRRFRMPGVRPFPNLYGRGDEESEDEQPEADHLAPLDNHHYGMMAGGGGILSYGPPPTSSARCYSADTGISREVLVPPPPPLLSNGGVPLYHPTCQTPLPPIPPLISTTCSPLKSATAVSYKPTGEGGVIAYSPASLAESGGSGSGQTRTTNADSPTHPLTDGSDNGGHRNDSSRNSQISSVDGRFQPLATFKSSSAVPPLMSTFAR